MRISTSSPSFHSVPQQGSAKPRPTAAKDESPIEQTLFGSVRPKLLDPAKFPHLVERMRWLSKQKVKIAAFLGDANDEYTLALADGMAACIDPRGRIYIGEKLLAEDPALLAGILAHEIGHRPKTWKKRRQGHGMTRAQLMQLARDEEAKADHTAGRVLAALDLSPEPLCAFLLAHGHFEKQPDNYYPVETRIAMIREAYQKQRTRAAAAKGLFPQMQRATSVKHLMQEDKRNATPTKRRPLAKSV